jgi:peptidoglycan/xylan/chitin deacetylase (PgdA/CDA1 family)
MATSESTAAKTMSTRTVSRFTYAAAVTRARPVSRFKGGLSRKLARYVVTKRVRARNERPLVSVTFDDIPESAFTYGARVLEDRGVRGTFYIAGGLCGTVEAERRLVSAADCVELHRRGHEIGCHTFSHSMVQALDADTFAAELDRNQEFFSSLMPGLKLENFCYPYGIASLPRKSQAQARFHSCRGSRCAINAGTIDLGLLCAVAIDHATDSAKVVRAIDATVRSNGWLILFTHDVSPQPTWIGCTPQFLDAALATALGRGCQVVAVREALRLMGAEP